MIIVTGGAGFIGSATIAALNSRGTTNILVVDKLGTDAKWKNLQNLVFTDYTEKGDFLNNIQHDRIVPPIEVILHLGACSSTTETDASYLIENNYQYTKTLAEWAVSKGIRFIYASSAATYGDGTAGFNDDEQVLDKLRPLNTYGYSKHLFDLWARRTGLLSKIVGLKYFNVFGPNEYHKGNMRSFVIQAFEQIGTTGKVRLFKSHRDNYRDGEQLRDFLYVKDAVDMTLFFLNARQKSGIFNIGTGKGRTWNDLANAVFTAMGKEPKIEYTDMPKDIRNQYQYFTQANISKLHNAGYKREPTALEDAVKDYIQNYLANGNYLSKTSFSQYIHTQNITVISQPTTPRATKETYPTHQLSVQNPGSIPMRQKNPTAQ